MIWKSSSRVPSGTLQGLVGIDFTDVTLVSDDTYRRLNWSDPDDPDDPDENYLVMKVI